MTPFPLDGGRAGDGGGDSTSEGHPHRPPRLQRAPGATERARKLRREMTLGEKVLWKELRRRGVHVRRQCPIGRYIADFAVLSAKLIIEVDGPHHEAADRVARDAERDLWLTSQGYRVLRFTTAAVLADPAGIGAHVLDVASPPPSPALPPSRGKGED